jgi:hypothetical protein
MKGNAPRERNQIGLELVQINVKSTIEPEGAGDGGNDLGNEPVQISERGRLNAKIASANIVDSLIVNHEGAVNVLEGGVSGKDGVVWLDDRRGHARSRVDGELELGFLAVVGRETLEEESTETGTRTTTERVKDEEA